MDSLYHTQINMSVGRGNIWGISVNSLYKGEVLFFPGVYILKKVIKNIEVKANVQKGPKV